MLDNKPGIQFEPGLPTRYIEKYIEEKGFKVKKILSLSLFNTVVLVENNSFQEYPNELVIKLFFGYFTIAHIFKDELSNTYLYGFKFYQKLDQKEYEYWAKKFILEIKTLSSLQSRYWVNVFYCKLDAEVPYYIMEYYPDGNLDQYLRDNEPLTEEEVIQLAYQLFEGIKVLHLQKIIHRDITPYNILLKGGNLIWTDLGFARHIIEPMNSFEKKDPFIYWPPEYDNKFCKADERGDIYSIGIIMYRMLTGTLPRYNSPDVIDLNPNVSQDLSDLVMKCLQFYPDDRFQSADECLKILNMLNIGGF